MNNPRPAATLRTQPSLGPPHRLNALLRRAPQPGASRSWPSTHGAAAGIQGSGNDFTAAASPFCSNLRQLLLPPAGH